MTFSPSITQAKLLIPQLADLSVLTPAQSTQTDFTQAIEESSPETDAQVAAPGAGEITIAPITVSASQIGPDGTCNPIY